MDTPYGRAPSADSFLPPRPDSMPTIYAYKDTNPQYAALLTVGYTTEDEIAFIESKIRPMEANGE